MKKTMKKNKLSVASKIKSLASTLWFKYVKNPITNLWYNKVKKPYLARKEEKARLAEIKKIQDAFTKGFANHSEVTKLMYTTAWEQTNHENLTKDLLANRREMGQINGKVPTLYEPEINEIHNENLNPNNPTLSYIIKKDRDNATEALNYQKRMLDVKQGIIIPKNKQERPITSSVFDETTQDDLEGYMKEVSIKGIRNLDSMVNAEKFNSFMKNIESSKNK
jgi:hypothetical protein